MGATLAFRRTRKERALDHQIAWHETTIRALARLEGELERLHRESRYATVVETASRLPEGHSSTDVAKLAGQIPDKFRPTAEAWADLNKAESEARATLRLADVYTEGRVKVECSVALDNVVNLATTHWFDIGPQPEIPWATLATRILKTAQTRRYVQESLRIVLELQGLLGSVLGPRYRRWKTLRELDKIRQELERAS